ncbi:MAG: APC family permease [Candidatus Tyrphobacter sp.]
MVRSLGLTASASILICNVIGQGVFLKTRVMTCELGGALPVVAVWLLAGLLSLCGALSLGELGAMMPRSGGMYVFLRRAYGAMPAFAFGWMSFWVTGPAATAALAAGAAIFFNMLTHGELDFSNTVTLFGLHVTMTGLQLTSVSLIAVCVFVNLFPIGVNGGIATVLTVAKVAVIAALSVGAFAFAHGTWAHYAQSSASGACTGIRIVTHHGPAALAAAFIAALYAYQGWAIITSIGGEIRNPGRIIPLALCGSTLVVIVCYLTINVAYFFALSPAQIASLAPGSSVAVALVNRIFGGSGEAIAAAILFVSTIAALHTTLLTDSRIAYALTRDGVLFPAIGTTSQQGVPVRAVLANGAIAVFLAALGTFDTLSNYFIFNVWLFNVGAVGALFVLRRREPDVQRPYRAWLYPVVPMLFVTIASWILVQTFVSAPLNSSIGLAIVGLGILFYIYRTRNGTEAPAPKAGGEETLRAQ